MMKLIKVDPSTSKNSRITSTSTCLKTVNKSSKSDKAETGIFSSSVKNDIPIIFHKVHSNKISECAQPSEHQSLSDAFNSKFGKEVAVSQPIDDNLLHPKNTNHTPLRIKIDPKYHSMQLAAKKNSPIATDNRNRRITFISSSSKGSTIPIFISDNLQSSTFAAKKSISNDESSSFPSNSFCEAPLPSKPSSFSPRTSRNNAFSKPSKKLSKNQKRVGNSATSEEITKKIKKEMKRQLVAFNQLRCQCDVLSGDAGRQTLSGTASLRGKFSSDTRIKLNKNRLTTSSDFFTGTFRVKIRGREKL